MSPENRSLLFTSALSYSVGRGDWIPDVYKKVFQRKEGGADLAVCCVLSKIIFWHTPNKKGKKKYRGEHPYLSAAILAEQLYLSKKQVRRSLEALEFTYKVIERRKHGRRVYVKLNEVEFSKLIMPYLKEQGTESILAPYTEGARYLPSGANEEGVHLPSGANETPDSRPQGQTYNIKRKHTKLSEKKVFKISDDVIAADSDPYFFDKSLLEVRKLSMSVEAYSNSCKVVQNFVQMQLSLGKPISELMTDFLTNSLLDNIAYPAFARLHCLVHEGLLDNCNEADFEKLLYVLKSECGSNPDLANRLKENCPDVDYSIVDLDIEEHIKQARLKVSKVMDEALKQNNKLENTNNENNG
jgi:hypothetical protein